MFNLSGSEIVFLLLIALIVLGPEKLPEAVRRFGKFYAEFKKMSTGFQSELKSALDEPMREMRETAEAIKKAADFDFITDVDFDAADEPAVAPAAIAEAASANGSTDEPTPATPPPSEVQQADAVETVDEARTE